MAKTSNKSETPIRTSTRAAAKLDPVGKDREVSLRGGDHLTPQAVAMVLIGGDAEQKIELNKTQIIRNMLATATDDEIAAVIRSRTNNEKVTGTDGRINKNAPQNYGPLVVALVDHGMSIETAKVRASEFKTVVQAFPHANGMPEDVGYHSLVEAARRRLDRAKADAERKQSEDMRRDLAGKYLFDHPDADREKALSYAEQQLEREEANAKAESERKSIERRTKELFKLSVESQTSILMALAENLGYTVQPVKKGANITAGSKPEVETREAVH